MSSRLLFQEIVLSAEDDVEFRSFANDTLFIILYQSFFYSFFFVKYSASPSFSTSIEI